MKDPNANRPGYKETKVGWIPEEWDSGRVGEVCSQPISGYSANGSDSPCKGNELGVLKLSCISNGGFDHTQNKAVRDSSQVAKLSTPVQANTLVISRSNTVELVGAVGFVRRDHPNLFLSDLLWSLVPTGGADVSMRWLATCSVRNQ